MTQLRRVVVTGMGVVSALGQGVEEFWSGLVAGKGGIRALDDESLAAFSTRIAAQITAYHPTLLERSETRDWDRSLLFAVDAAHQAVSDAGLVVDEDNAARTGVYIGSGIGGIETLNRTCETLVTSGRKRTSPYFIPMMIPNMAAGLVAMEFGAQGPCLGLVSACATGNHAIGEACLAIAAGRADRMIAGGSEAPLTPLAMAGFCSMKAMSTRNDVPQEACAPFDQRRDGFVMGEGAGILVLEELEQALARGATIYAEVCGYGSSCDAYHLTAPHPDGRGALSAMRQALTMAGWQPEQVDYINAHGTGTPIGDRVETRAIKQLMGKEHPQVAVSSTKSATGHLLGAAGGIEVVAVIQSLNHNLIPPTLNLHQPDPECDLDYVPLVARPQPVTRALSNGFGFGGHNAVLALAAWNQGKEN
ncbi:beta-ketoacyl-ACP synthase II [Desulfuromonas acetoxidans]|uniref:3-oxoacyl-[acyl-carrier-protein] synthase 2 n=1 Tax=Desulfuromonas acetoxidans (strain DSM 684 / 11070) TaxID=281689 RepID=Q1K026_DESA6|nr:beta-ketoacyl-ACP synthase II [Desulfuromonas acetoxidans]EAT15716.1 beta-ketoacyl synthase [Desulfuromonas acetoxidans DSM 684]MBF0646639.1 beta-ketoacyl-ACP synthase II [Desulfuromonas acetoxidans]NVD26084.1 beta-ketoacyl-ACP synthase II [Desulfuromonas acetoxidans]NVE16926.1 beta-ketoacyl-ACP synthase II [Desulfuromonas acetoxidans]